MRFDMWARLIAIIFVASACDDEAAKPTVDVDVSEFQVEATDQAEIDQAIAQGDAAEGSYTHDDASSAVTLDITASTFGCGVVEGIIEATIVELTATTMVWSFPDGGSAIWTRVDTSSDATPAGIWRTTDPALFLVLSADGSAQIFGEGEVCDDERDRNEDRCYELVPSGVAITLDGDLSEWTRVSEQATLRDDANDHEDGDPGSDIRALKVELADDALYVLLQLYNAPSTNYQAGPPPWVGSYRLTVQGDNGLSMEERVAYSPATQTWATLSSYPGIEAAVGSDGIEWRVDISPYLGEGFKAIDLIMVDALGCTDQCTTADIIGCGFVEL